MRLIHVANLDKARPVLVLTRALVRPHMTRVTVRQPGVFLPARDRELAEAVRAAFALD